MVRVGFHHKTGVKSIPKQTLGKRRHLGCVLYNVMCRYVFRERERVCVETFYTGLLIRSNRITGHFILVENLR